MISAEAMISLFGVLRAEDWALFTKPAACLGLRGMSASQYCTSLGRENTYEVTIDAACMIYRRTLNQGYGKTA